MFRFRLVVLICFLAAAAHAAPSDEAEAKTLFDRGKQAMSAGRFDEARDLFQRSLDLVAKPSASFNLAVALRGMGRPKESSALLLQLLEGRYGELPPERRNEVERLAREEAGEIAKLRISATGADRIDVRVDGLRVATLSPNRAISVEVNPGERVVTLSARKRDTVERRVTLAPGKSASISATLGLSRAARRARLVVVAKNSGDDVEIEGVGRARGRLDRQLDPGQYVIVVHSREGTRETSVLLQPATEHRVELDPASGSVLSSPWFWVGTSAVLVGAGVGGYFLFRSRERDPVSDPEFQVVQTLGRSGRR